MKKLLVLGDSIMYGYMSTGLANPSVPESIANILGIDVTNDAHSGTCINSNDSNLAEISQNINFDPFSIVMIGYGANDWLQGRESLDDMKMGLDVFKSKLNDQKVLIELPILSMMNNATSTASKNSLGISQDDLCDMLKNYATSSGWSYYDWRDNPIVTPENYKQTLSDGLEHPNQDTYNKMAAALSVALKPLVDSAPDKSLASHTYKPTAPTRLAEFGDWKYIFFGFDPDGESSSNPWKATPVLCGSNDAVTWTVIDHFSQLGNLRDGNIAVYKDWAYITGTTGMYRTKDFKNFEELDTSFLSRSGYKDIWAPEFFVDLDGNWHVVWCANDGARHIYVGDFDPETGQVTNAWRQVEEDGGIDPHIWTYSNQYYLSIDGYWLYKSDDYMGPYELIRSNMVHDGENSSHWYEAGESLIDGDTIYFYMDSIDGSVPGVSDSGHMVVQTAQANDLTTWSGPQDVVCSINMRHGSFLNLSGSASGDNQPPADIPKSIQLQSLSDVFKLKDNSASNWSTCLSAINALWKAAEKLSGEETSQIKNDLTDPGVELGRLLRNYVINVVIRLERYVNELVDEFNKEGIVDPKTGEGIKTITVTPPRMLVLNDDYEKQLNDDWKLIEKKINELFTIAHKYHI